MKAWNAPQTKSSGTPYNVEGGFDVVDKFKADQKEGFRQAAPIIHDLVMDAVRSTGGEIPYTVYVISEHGVVEYLGGQLQEKIDDVAGTAQFAREHPLQAGGMAVVAIAAGGRVLGAKRTKKRPGLLKKANPAKDKPNINASPTSNPAIHGGRNSSSFGNGNSKDANSNNIHETGDSSSNAGKANSGGNIEPIVGNMPDRVKWIREGGRFVTHADGTTTFIKNGTSVRYNSKGFPDFRPFLYKGNNGKSEVPITLTGNRTKDEALANAAAGFSDWSSPIKVDSDPHRLFG